MHFHFLPGGFSREIIRYRESVAETVGRYLEKGNPSRVQRPDQSLDDERHDWRRIMLENEHRVGHVHVRKGFHILHARKLVQEDVRDVLSSEVSFSALQM